MQNSTCTLPEHQRETPPLLSFWPGKLSTKDHFAEIFGKMVLCEKFSYWRVLLFKIRVHQHSYSTYKMLTKSQREILMDCEKYSRGHVPIISKMETRWLTIHLNALDDLLQLISLILGIAKPLDFIQRALRSLMNNVINRIKWGITEKQYQEKLPIMCWGKFWKIKECRLFWFQFPIPHRYKV